MLGRSVNQAASTPDDHVVREHPPRRPLHHNDWPAVSRVEHRVADDGPTGTKYDRGGEVVFSRWNHRPLVNPSLDTSGVIAENESAPIAVVIG